MSQSDASFDFDLVVLGGGSGGLAASKEAAKFGKRVAVFDFVKPSPQGSQWGLGGTCVNVGCIPKKLMHTAALLGEESRDAAPYGWNLKNEGHDWERMVQNVQNHISSINWGYRVQLRSEHVTYKNEYATLLDAHTVEATNRKGIKSKYTTRDVLIATGGRPTYPDVPGAEECCITSDDIFSLPHSPGRTLVIGASYVSLECAGFLKGLGYDVTVMVRSILLRGFDQQIAEMIGKYMSDHGTNFIRPTVPTKFTKLDDGKVKVEYKGVESGEAGEDVFDTVMIATGRTPCTAGLGLEEVGCKLAPNKKLVVTNEQTSVPNIYAIGDIIQGGLELTPVAIQAGRLLARRLYGGGTKQMNYQLVPTTVFTPLEYGACGLSEEDAIEKYGADNIEVFHSYFKPLEWTVAQREDNACYHKLVCNKAEGNRVVGLHILGPHAGEVTQGFATALLLGATKDDFDDTVGIHPTVAEEFTTMSITKASGADPQKSAC